MRKHLEYEDIEVHFCNTKSTGKHSHEFLELVYVTQGQARHIVNKNEMLISRGDYFFIDYHTMHEYHSVKDEPFQVINCLFLPKLIDKSLVYCTSFNSLLNHYLIKLRCDELQVNPANHIFHDNDGSIYMYMKFLFDEFENKQIGSIELIRCKLIELIIHTMRKISKETVPLDSENASNYIAGYLKENYRKHLTLTELSGRLNYSVPYISKKFKEDIGMSFNQYIQKLRIEQSCVLLANTNKKILEIAELVGYSDVNFFHQAFKKQIKLTPLQFRKMTREPSKMPVPHLS